MKGDTILYCPCTLVEEGCVVCFQIRWFYIYLLKINDSLAINISGIKTGS